MFGSLVTSRRRPPSPSSLRALRSTCSIVESRNVVSVRSTTVSLAPSATLVLCGTVRMDDLKLLAYLGESHNEIELLAKKVPQLLGEG